MPVTMATLLADARVRLDEASARQWTDANIRMWINEGAKDISRKTETIQDRETTAAVIGTAEYTLPASTLRVHRVEFKADSGSLTRELMPVDVRNMDGFGWEYRSMQDSYPYVFTIWGAATSLKLIVYPVPSEDGDFTIWYYRQSTALAEDGTADASNVEIPEGWNDIVLDYVEYRALRKDRDSRWVDAKAMYDENLSVMYDNTRRWTDQAGVIVPGTGSMPVWLTAFE